MSANAPANVTTLETAATEMRSLIQAGETSPPWFDAAAVGRMLAHVDNIHRSVTVSSKDHINAAKRLNDFARIFARFAVLTEVEDGPLASRMTSVSDNLRAASEELARGDVVPVNRAVALESH